MNLEKFDNPILFLARGRSGTTRLTKLLDRCGVYMGNSDDKALQNPTWDNMPFTRSFQHILVPKLFEYGKGCRLDEELVLDYGMPALRRHLKHYTGGSWGFKTCGSMFAHPLYRFLFPNAKYIYLIRDGRDVTISRNGRFHMGWQNQTRYRKWEYLKVLTFGISNDFDICPFEFPEKPTDGDSVHQNRYWINAKSWREHVRMMEHLRDNGELSSNVHTVKHEDLCTNTIPTLEKLFDFLEIDFNKKRKEIANGYYHTDRIGRWKHMQKKHGKKMDNGESMGEIFNLIKPELKKEGYK